MNAFRAVAAAGLAALSAACATAPETPPAKFSFPVIGDIPYSDQERVLLLETIVPAIKAGDYPFVVHIGDYKSGGAPCTAAEDEAQLALIESLAPAPVFYTPGDNEWTDCDRFADSETGEPESELERLKRLRALFYSDDIEAPAAMRAMRQPELPDHATWVYSGARFATVHIVGTGNGRRAIDGDDPALAAAEADKREAAALAWLSTTAARARAENASALVIAIHADMTDVNEAVLGKPCKGASAGREQSCDAFAALRAAVRDAARRFGGPTLLIHGDTAPFTLGQAFAGDEAANLWILNAAGDHGFTDQGLEYGVADATLVTINPGDPVPFEARGVATGAPASAQ